MLSYPPTAGIAILGVMCILVELTRWQDDRGSLKAIAKTIVRSLAMALISTYIAILNPTTAYAFLILNILQAHKQLIDLIIPYYNCTRA